MLLSTARLRLVSFRISEKLLIFKLDDRRGTWTNGGGVWASFGGRQAEARYLV